MPVIILALSALLVALPASKDQPPVTHDSHQQRRAFWKNRSWGGYTEDGRKICPKGHVQGEGPRDLDQPDCPKCGATYAATGRR